MSATIGVVSSKQSRRIGVGIGQGHKTYLALHGVLLSRSHRYKLKFCKESPTELNSVRGEWPIRVKAAPNLFNLTNKKINKLIRKRLWGNV